MLRELESWIIKKAECQRMDAFFKLVELSLDIINLGNLLSRSWGLVHRTSSWALSPVTITSLESVDGGYRPVYKFTGAEYTTDDIASRWHMQIGVRVVF